MEAFLLRIIALFLAVFCPLSTDSRPMGGKFHDVIYLTKTSVNPKENSVNGTCHMIGLYEGSTVSIDGHINTNDSKEVNLTIQFRMFKLECANFLDMDSEIADGKPCSQNLELEASHLVTPFANGMITGNYTESKMSFKFHPNMTRYAKPIPPTTTTTPTPAPAKESTPVPATADSKPTSTDSKPTSTDSKPTSTDSKPPTTLASSKPSPATSSSSKSSSKRAADDKTDSVQMIGKHEVAVKTGANHSLGAGMYLLQIFVEAPGNMSLLVTTDVHIEMRNPHGYLSAVDYPGLVFYSIMTSVYAIYGIAWIVMMLCAFSDLVRLQFWVLAVIILGFLEKTFFVAEYSAINLGNDTYGSYIIAEFVSAVKRGLSRMLLIIVAMGFGTVKPRLGDSLFKVVAAGVAYFSLALVDGMMRSRTNTFHTNDTSSIVTLALLLLLDTFIFYWIFTAIVDTRRTLRLRKNYVKLTMYNHFAYTLIFAIVVTIAFTVWVFVDLEFPKGLCLTDWGEVWLRDCFWHVLFAFILLVVMVIWRPSSNRSRFSYSLVANPDDDEIIFEQGSNKNFDTVKMRTVSKSGLDHPPPPVTSQAEDDLRWVEENLPTTAMDKALPLLLDSDEEVMTTKFEVSKMN